MLLGLRCVCEPDVPLPLPLPLPPFAASPLEHLLCANRDAVLWSTRARAWASYLRSTDLALEEPQDEFEQAPLPPITVNRNTCVRMLGRAAQGISS